jgi:uncharacterized protein YceK
MKKALILLIIGITTVGCATTYTSIQPAGEKSYYITRVKQGFFKVSGALYQCTADGKKMTCSEVDSR